MPTKQFKITSSNFLYIIERLMQLSEETLDRNKVPDDEEYLETTRLILDRLSESGLPIDYTEAEKKFRINRCIISEVKEWMEA